MNLTEQNVERVALAVSLAGALAVSGLFLAATLAGDYDWVARLGGSAWVVALMTIILIPTVQPLLRARVTGEKVRFEPHDHDAMLVGEERRREKEERVIVKDVVCGMDVDPATAAASSEYEGQTYYFCSLACKKSFDADPAEYLGR
jgi:YHS domain-containing protein